MFLVQNNGWAISTPQSAQMAVVDVADKAAGYGMPGMICDGTDPIATYRTMKVAMDRARSGGGPTLVEAKCYRFLSHSTDDDDRTYRDRERWSPSSAPTIRCRSSSACLLEAGIIDDAGLAAMKADVLQARPTTRPTPPKRCRIHRSTTCTTNVYAGAAYEPWLE